MHVFGIQLQKHANKNYVQILKKQRVVIVQLLFQAVFQMEQTVLQRVNVQIILTRNPVMQEELMEVVLSLLHHLLQQQELVNYFLNVLMLTVIKLPVKVNQQLASGQLPQEQLLALVQFKLVTVLLKELPNVLQYLILLQHLTQFALHQVVSVLQVTQVH